MFSKTIYSAVLIGVVAGLILSLGQALLVNPIIFEAESYEVVSPPPVVTDAEAGQTMGSATHHHGTASTSAVDDELTQHEPWSPADGAERSGWTLGANLSVGIGFAAIMLALMSQLQLMNVTRLSALKGSLWGLAGFAAVFVAPGIGLPPEIPGIEAAALESRQGWWLFAVVSVGVGLLVLGFARGWYKLLAFALLALPYLVHIPHPTGPAFLHPDPAVVSALNQLHHSFIIFSGLTACVFWIALGVGCGWILNHWVLTDLNEPDASA